MTKKYNLYLGKAGHLSVMSEFLVRGWNVAIPEVDVGDDIFVVEDQNGTMKRVQVKTSSVTIRKKSFSALYQIPAQQLRALSPTLIYYIFIARANDNTWVKPLIIRQDILLELCENNDVGSEYKDNIGLYFSYSIGAGKVMCSKQGFTKYIADYNDFPIIEH